MKRSLTSNYNKNQNRFGPLVAKLKSMIKRQMNYNCIKNDKWIKLTYGDLLN
jgi:hypothetical protein